MLNLRFQMYFEAQDGRDHAPDGPGWYLSATSTDEGQLPLEVIPRIRISNEEALDLANVIDGYTLEKPLNWNPVFDHKDDLTLKQGVAETTNAGAEIIKSQLEHTKDAVARLDRLKHLAKEFGIES